MRILFASGKGGAGKTTVTAGLARAWPRSFVLADADVEAPDLALFLPHALPSSTPVSLEVPVKITEACDLCGECLDICQFKAIVKLGKRIVPFPNMCHSCGGCTAVCSRQAILTGERVLGSIAEGTAFDAAPFFEGRSRIGEAMTPPLIRALLKKASDAAADRRADLLIDAPPGVSCPVTTAARYADAVVFVADPTPFGVHDFRLAVAALREAGKPAAVIINRTGQPGNDTNEAALRDWCRSNALPVAAELPFAREAAECAARSLSPAEALPGWLARFEAAAAALCTLLSESRHA